MSEPAVPDSVATFRENYRRTSISPTYPGWLHFTFTTVASLSVIVFAATRVSNVKPLEWIVIPAAFLLSNAAEYFGHKGPMHRPRPGLGLLFRRHTKEHHHYFTHEAMTYETSRDFKMVLFPPVMIFFFLGVIATPIALVLFWLATPNVGWLFVVTGMSYFLSYEWLHFAYHLSEDSWVAKLPFMATLRRHHTQHHDLALMGKYNFNITFPICDAIFGTSYRGDD